MLTLSLQSFTSSFAFSQNYMQFNRMSPNTPFITPFPKRGIRVIVRETQDKPPANTKLTYTLADSSMEIQPSSHPYSWSFYPGQGMGQLTQAFPETLTWYRRDCSLLKSEDETLARHSIA